MAKVITDGNDLLVENGHWANVRPLLDDVWYVDTEESLRTGRLAERHELFGRSREEAIAWIERTDEPNARLIESTRAKADIFFRWNDD